MRIWDYFTKKNILSSGGAVGILITLIKNTSTVASASKAIITFLGTEQGATLGTTGISIIVVGGSMLYTRILHDEQMRRMNEIEKRIDESIDDVKTKLDKYHETDVRTYERLSMQKQTKRTDDLNDSSNKTE